MKVAALALAAASVDASTSPSFAEFMVKYNKKYSSPEELQLRRAIYAAKVALVEKHNSEGHPWFKGINEFSDLTKEEFKSRYLGGVKPSWQAQEVIDHVNGGKPIEEFYKYSPENVEAIEALPASWDWQQKGGVSGVKNQGSCGSCWAFSTVGSLETATWLKLGGQPSNLYSLSEQQVIDCTSNGFTGNDGCKGGDMLPTLKALMESKMALCTENDYPYSEADHNGDDDGVQGCQVITSGYCTPPGPPNVNATYVPILNEQSLMQAVTVTAIAAGIEADEIVDYAGGVYTGQCGINIDHGVVLVGFSSDNGVDFWRIKNSWGNTWGEAGYFRLGRGTKFNPLGQCGIQLNAVYPVM